MKKLLAVLVSLLMVSNAFLMASCSGEGGIETAGGSTPEPGQKETDGGSAPEGEKESETETEKETEKPADELFTPDPANKYTGKIGIGTYSTHVNYSNVKVVNNANRKTLLNEKFENLDAWTAVTTGGGNWNSADMSGVQVGENGVEFTDKDAQGATLLTGDEQWGNINVSVTATAVEGTEGIRIFFDYKDENNYCVFNCGGWSNSVACVEIFENGASTTTDQIPFTVKYGEEYTITLNIGADTVGGFINGEQIFQMGGEAPENPFSGMVGLACYQTEAYIDNIKVTSFKDGSVLYENDFSDASRVSELKHDIPVYSGGNYNGSADVFVVENETLHQTDSSMTGVMAYFGDPTWTNYDYSFDYMPVNGIEGGVIVGAINADKTEYIIYNCGGWSNTKGCWQVYSNGDTTNYDGDAIETSLTYDEWNNLRLIVTEYAIFSYINGEFFQAYWAS